MASITRERSIPFNLGKQTHFEDEKIGRKSLAVFQYIWFELVHIIAQKSSSNSLKMELQRDFTKKFIFGPNFEYSLILDLLIFIYTFLAEAKND